VAPRMRGSRRQNVDQLLAGHGVGGRTHRR
jgi:hypothetical protein